MADLFGKAHFVRDAHHGHALIGQLHHHVQHLADHFWVERRGRFIEQHHDRVHRQRTRNRHPLLLTAGELTGELVLVGRQAHSVQHLHAARHRIVLAAAQHLDLRHRQVLGHAEVREQLEMLEHHAHARAQLGQVGLGVGQRHAVHHDVALLKRLQGIDGLDQGRFARTGRAANHHDLALFDLGGAVGQHLEGAVPLGNVLDFNHGKALDKIQRMMAIFFCSRRTSMDRLKQMTK